MKGEQYFRELDREHERKLEARDRARALLNPVFSLKCPCCGHQWEQAVAAGADAPSCPKCFGPAMVNRVRS